jgi:hypothetical protein
VVQLFASPLVLVTFRMIGRIFAAPAFAAPTA